MFYVIMFSLLAVLLVVAGLTVISRNRSSYRMDEREGHRTATERKQRKAKRSQSRHDRRSRR
jgi:hypothetical protein